MITILKKEDCYFKLLETVEPNCWIHVSSPAQDEIQLLTENYKIDPDFIVDALDIDEQSMIEKEEDGIYIIYRIPMKKERDEIPYFTVPLGIVVKNDFILTITLHENDLINDIIRNRIKFPNLENKEYILLRLFFRSSTFFLRYLKEINSITTSIENKLRKSVENKELIKLLVHEKSLVYFTTSLKSNELLLKKIQRLKFFSSDEEKQDLLEDILTENEQAIEMANIYSNILSGMMDAFASIISNNLNVVMKRLTSISLILMFPTMIASYYGMNVHLPFQNTPLAFTGIMVGSVILAAMGAIFLKFKKYF